LSSYAMKGATAPGESVYAGGKREHVQGPVTSPRKRIKERKGPSASCELSAGEAAFGGSLVRMVRASAALLRVSTGPPLRK